MSFDTRLTLPNRPPLRLDIQRGTVQLTSGADDFRKILLLNALYWPSTTAGEGLFRHPESKKADPNTGSLLRVDLQELLLYPEGNPFDEELQRIHSLKSLWRVIPDLPAKKDYKAALRPRPMTDLRPKLEARWDEIFARMVEEAMQARKGKGLYRVLPSFVRRVRAKSVLSKRWPEFKAMREEEFQEIATALESLATDEPSWEDHEKQRVLVLERLLAGDASETNAAVRRVLTNVFFPFDVDLDVRIEDAATVRLAFQVPQLDRIVQPSTRALLGSGEVRKVKRDREEIHRDFSVLVAGQAGHVAAVLFAALPALQTVSVACATIPPNPVLRRGRARIQAEAIEPFFIFDVEFNRTDFEDDLLAPFEPIPFLAVHHARMNPLSSVALGRIEPPEWLAGVKS
jgi:hypothetical protein